MKYRTFNEWSSDGYRIDKGSKSSRKSKDGTPLFSEDQVTFMYWPRKYAKGRVEFDDEYERELDSYFMPDYIG